MAYTLVEFRADIRAAELLAAKVKPGIQTGELIDLFRKLDRISTGDREFHKTGVDLRAELTRLETVHNTVRDQCRLIVRTLGRRGEFASLRVEYGPPGDHSNDHSSGHWWWYLDQHVAKQRANAVRRLLWSSAGILVLLVALGWAYIRFLRPDEATRLRYKYVLEGDLSVERGDYVAALENYQKAFDVSPGDAEVNLMIGVMYEALQHPKDAAEYYDRAETMYDARESFFATRSQKYSLLGWYDNGEADARAAIEASKEFAPAYCALGTAYEGQGEIAEAVAALRVCADLASEQGHNELYVIASTRLAMLLQSPPR